MANEQIFYEDTKIDVGYCSKQDHDSSAQSEYVLALQKQTKKKWKNILNNLFGVLCCVCSCA